MIVIKNKIISIIFSSFLIALVLIFPILIDDQRSWAKDGENRRAILKVERQKQTLAAGEDVYLYLDGVKIGSLGNGDTREFYIPTKTTEQILTLEDRFGFITFGERKLLVSPGDRVSLEFHRNVFSVTITKFHVERYANLSHVTKDDRNSEGRHKVEIVELKIYKNLRAKSIKESPVYRIPKGQEKIVEDSVKITRTVMTTNESKTGGDIKLDWKFIQIGIQKEIQKSISRSNSIESEVKRSIKIIGDGQGVKVVWAVLYRTGLAVVKVDGQLLNIPFEYEEDFDLYLEAAEET